MLGFGYLPGRNEMTLEVKQGREAKVKPVSKREVYADAPGMRISGEPVSREGRSVNLPFLVQRT